MLGHDPRDGTLRRVSLVGDNATLTDIDVTHNVTNSYFPSIQGNSQVSGAGS